MRLLKGILVLALPALALADDPPAPEWQNKLHAKFDAESARWDSSATKDRKNLFACNFYTSKAIEVVFGLKDKLPEGAAAGNLENNLKASQDWEYLGPVTDSAKLKEGRNLVSAGTPVVAIGAGHIALLVPYDGPNLRSTKWTHGDLPCVTNWHQAEKEASFVVGKISRAWGTEDKGKVNLYKYKGPPSGAKPLATKVCLGREAGRGPASGKPASAGEPWMAGFAE